MIKAHTNSPELKARVATEAISGRKTLQEIAADGAERMIQVSHWMGQLLDGVSEYPRRRRCPTLLRQRCNELGG